jgi:flagellar export protein FliJ
MAGKARFQYPLDALLQLRQQEMDVARAEKLLSHKVFEEKRQTLSEIDEGIEQTEQELRELFGEGRVVEIQRQGIVAAYLAALRRRREIGLADLAKAEQIHEQARLSLQNKARGVRALVRHRETKLGSFLVLAAAEEHKTQDELWLSRRAVGK